MTTPSPQQVRREETDGSSWKQFSKLIRGSRRGGDHICQTKVFPPPSREGGSRREAKDHLETASRGRGRGGTIICQVEVVPPTGPPSREGGKQKTILKQLAEGEGEGGPYLSDKSGPPSKEDRHFEIAYQGGPSPVSIPTPA